MKPVDDYFKNPKRSIGGAVVPLIGPQGCGKTNVLIQLALMRKRQDNHKVLWRGTEQGEWIKFLSNDEEVTVWNHKHLDRVRVKASDSTEVEYLELEDIPSIEVKEFEDADKVVKESSKDRINVVNIPGLFGHGKEGRTFFTKKNIDILEAIVRRENTYNFLDFFTDEAGDIWPCQQQLSGNQYEQVATRTPPLLSQLRKQNCFMYLASHGTQDLHYFVWKIKSNTIAYMSNSKVKNFHSSVDQWKVNALDRGQVIVPPKDKEKFALAFEEDNLGWVDGRHIDLVWEDSLDEKFESEEDEEEDKLTKTEEASVGRKIYDKLKDDEKDITQEEIAEAIDVDRSTLAQA